MTHTSRALGSDQRVPLPLWPTRHEHVHDGNKQNLVDTWLEGIETSRHNESLSKESGSKARSRPGSGYQLRGLSPSRVSSRDSHNGPVSKALPRKSRREHKRLRDLVQDKSVLGLCDDHDPAQVQPEVSLIVRPVSAATESNYESGKKRSHMGSEGSVVSVISGGQYHFEKKARHKTRSDRYNTTRFHEPRKAEKKKRKKPGDQSRTSNIRRGGDFSSAREVMDNFNSKSVLSDRITVSTPPPGQ